MYLVIDDMNNEKTFGTLVGVHRYVKDKLKKMFNLGFESEEEKNLYLALTDDFFLHDMKPDLTPFFDSYDCYLSDLFSIYKQIM